MYVDDFPACCGIQILTDLDVLDDDVWNEQKQEYEYKKDDLVTAQSIYDCITSSKGSRSHGRGPGLLLAVTAPFQKEVVPFLEEFGFKILREFVNPIHGVKNKLILWEINLVKIKVASLKKVLKKYEDIRAAEEKKAKEIIKKREEKLKKKAKKDGVPYEPGEVVRFW